MANLTIRSLDDDLKTRLRLQAAQNGHSMEQEVRDILARAVRGESASAGFAERVRARFAGLDADDLPIPARRAARLPEPLAE
jgi:plasmid stability protein